jgi:hypothetical protein
MLIGQQEVGNAAGQCVSLRELPIHALQSKGFEIDKRRLH